MWFELDLHVKWWGKIVLSAICIVPCAIQLYKTKGEKGIGWFIILMLMVWGG